jgi:hypothetical protein
MAIQSTAGVQVYVSTGGSTTQAQFEALTWTSVDQVESIGEFGDTFNPVIFQGMEGRSKHFKGSVDAGDFSLSYAFCDTCSGQAFFTFYEALKFVMGIKIVFPGGQIRYFNGHIFSIKEALPNADSILMVNCSIGIEGPIIRVT